VISQLGSAPHETNGAQVPRPGMAVDGRGRSGGNRACAREMAWRDSRRLPNGSLRQMAAGAGLAPSGQPSMGSDIGKAERIKSYLKSALETFLLNFVIKPYITVVDI